MEYKTGANSIYIAPVRAVTKTRHRYQKSIGIEKVNATMTFDIISPAFYARGQAEALNRGSRGGAGKINILRR